MSDFSFEEKFSTLLAQILYILKQIWPENKILGIKYCDETTLHGYRYFTKPGLMSQLIWLLAVTSCSICAVYYGLYKNFSDFLEVHYITLLVIS